jgi:Domain of unknown function (DUF4395)
MTTDHQCLSATRIKFLKAQGYSNLSDDDISELAFGNRFAYIVCGSIVAVAVATAHIPTLIAMMVVAFLGVILPYHPFDYIYNHVLRGMLNKPKLPPRSKQLKFTCVIATLWLFATTYLFYSGLTNAGYVLGGLLVAVAFIVSTTDFCIPSTIYNFIFRVKT